MSIPELSTKSLPELIKLVHDHEANAVTVLLKKISPKLNGFVHALARRVADEDDIIVETEIRVERYLDGDGYEEQDTFIEMLYTIAKNATYDFYKRTHEAAVRDDRTFYWLTDDEPDEFEQLSKPEQDALRHRILMKAIPGLSPQQQMVVLFRIIDELSNEQIGALLNISAKDVGTVYSQATKRLKEIIERYKKEAKEKEQKIFSPFH